MSRRDHGCRGATFLDVGGESTRPGAARLASRKNWIESFPLVSALLRAGCLSLVDTSSPAVMTKLLHSGAGLINDVRALAIPEARRRLAAATAAVCLMHMQGAPSTMQKTPSYGSVVLEVFDFLKSRVAYSLECGIEQDRLLIDPGFGFGKTVQHNYQLLKNLGYFSQLEIPLLVGLSRKSMIGEVVARPVEQRLAGSIAATTLALASGARIIRTHDVAATMDAIRVNLAYSSAE